jgi:predicted dehydrogenase
MIRWGVIGPGAIANGFAQAMGEVDGGEIVAVASRSLERAAAFADRFEIPRRYGHAGELIADSDVDVVYVATPHSRHEPDAVAALEGGKHVLCEKPFALSAAQAQRMAHAARSRGLFLMEAMWTRFLPAYRALVDVLGSGRIGEPLFVEADFGYRSATVQPNDRHFARDLGGGALLELGIYPVQLCSLVLGLPEHVSADAVVGETGVDEVVAAVLRHSGGKLSVIKAALRVGLSCTARISGTDGWIDIPAFMHCPEWLTVTTRATGAALAEYPAGGNGMRFEIAEVHRCLAAGLTESPAMTLDETAALMSTLDSIRAQIGVVYPGE